MGLLVCVDVLFEMFEGYVVVYICGLWLVVGDVLDCGDDDFYIVVWYDVLDVVFLLYLCWLVIGVDVIVNVVVVVVLGVVIGVNDGVVLLVGIDGVVFVV